MKDDTIYLDNIDIVNGDIICTWLKDVEDIENITVHYAIGSSEWEIDKNNDYGFTMNNGFIIPTTALTPDTDYYFKLEYENSFTKALHVRLSKEQIKTSFIEGDRDGGDNTEQEMPSLTQPSKPTGSGSSHRPHRPSGTTTIIFQTEKPKTETNEPTEEKSSDDIVLNPDEPNKTPEKPNETEKPKNADKQQNQTLPAAENPKIPVEEKIIDTETVVTGERLEQMTKAQGGAAVFEKDGIVLELPEDFTEKNHITADDTVSVKIESETDKAAISVKVNDEPITDISGAKLRLPEENTKLIKSETEIVPESRRDGESVFPIRETGEYDTENIPKEKKIILLFIMPYFYPLCF